MHIYEKFRLSQTTHHPPYVAPKQTKTIYGD